MEEQVKNEEVKVEVVEEKKKFFTKKKLWVIGGVVAAAVAGTVLLLTRDKGGNEVENQNQILDEPAYESVNESEVVEQ